MKDTKIRLHPELGVNPRIIKGFCFLCGDVTDRGVALLGIRNKVETCPGCKASVYGGISSLNGCPKCGQTSHGTTRELLGFEEIKVNEPCDQCLEFMNAGVIFISVRDGESGNNPYRTGNWCVIKDEAITRIVNNEKLRDDILKQRVCFLEDKVWDKIGLPKNKENDNGGTTE